MSQDIDKAVSDFLQSVGVNYFARYMCETKKDNSWQCDQWNVEFSRNGKAFTEFYFTGLGHRKAVKDGLKDERRNYSKNSIGFEAWQKQYVRPVAPAAASVLHSLVMDSSAADESFDDWCANFGYDSDSIKAFRIYQDCTEIAVKLKQFFSKEELDKIAELTQDY